jgi:hypothetical protein
MQKNHLIGLSLVGLFSAIGTTALVVGCSDPVKVTPPVVTPDSGPDEIPDTSVKPDTGPKPVLAKIQVVHAAPVAGAVRICFATVAGIGDPNLTTDVGGLPPLPNTPNGEKPAGLPPGAGGPLPSTGTDLSGVTMKPVLFSVASLVIANGAQRPKPQPEFSCPELLNPALPTAAKGLIKDKDYFVLPNLPPGTFANGKTIVVVAAGCPAGIVGDAVANCGEDYDVGKSNLRAITLQLDNTPAAAGKIKAQFLHASAGADPFVNKASAGATKAVKPWLKTGAEKTFFGSPGTLTFKDNSIAATTPAIEVAVDQAATTVGIDVGAMEYAAGTLPISLVAAITVGGAPPAGYFAPTKGYTFIAVGDPTKKLLEDRSNVLEVLHYLALPNDPIIPDFK